MGNEERSFVPRCVTSELVYLPAADMDGRWAPKVGSSETLELQWPSFVTMQMSWVGWFP